MVPFIAEGGVGDSAAKVLAHFAFRDNPPDSLTDATGACEPAGRHSLGDVCQVGFGGVEQLVAFAGALVGQGTWWRWLHSGPIGS